MSPKVRRNSLIAIRIILGLVFLLSGTGKLFDSGYVNYDLIRLLSEKFFWIIEYAAPIMITISVIELLLAALLLWNKWLRIALSASLLMLLTFSSVLGYYYLQGTNIEGCGCFGAFGFGGGLEVTLIRNLVLMALIIGAFFLTNSRNPEP